MTKILEETKTDVAFNGVAYGGISNLTAKNFSMLDVEKVAGIVVAHLPPGLALTIRLTQCKYEIYIGGSSKNLGDSVVITNTTGTYRDVIGRIEAKASDFDAANGYVYVGLSASVTTAGGRAAGVIIRSGLAEKDSTVQSVISDFGVTTTTLPTTTPVATTTPD
jgi:hypothetical protein